MIKKRWALGFEGFCRKWERCTVWLLDRLECALIAEERGNAVFHEKDRLPQFYQENKSWRDQKKIFSKFALVNFIHGMRNWKAMAQNKAWLLKACNECRIVRWAASLSPTYMGYTASDEKSCTPFFCCFSLFVCFVWTVSDLRFGKWNWKLRA